MIRSENLTIMFTDISDFVALTSQQSREENRALLKTHDNLLLPVVRAYKGRLVKKIGDALLVVFRSPTDAVHCAMSMQDALWEYNRDADPDRQIHVRIALNQGDVRLEKGDVFGESVNIAARAECITPPGDIYFTASVFLAMNKTEVPYEPVGDFDLKGIPAAVTIYRVKPYNEEPGQKEEVFPFKQHYLLRLPKYSIQTVVRKTEREMKAGSRPVAKAVHFVTETLQHITLRTYMVVVLLLIFLGAGGILFKKWESLYPQTMTIRAEEAIDANRWGEAQHMVKKALEKNPQHPEALLLSGHIAFHKENSQDGLKYYEKALGLNESLKSNRRFITNLVAALDSVWEMPRDLILKYKSDELVVALVSRTVREGYVGRSRALLCLKEMGAGGKIDAVEVALLDLKEVKTCDQRRAVIRILQDNTLSASQRQRALPLLKRLAAARPNDAWSSLVMVFNSLGRKIGLWGGGDSPCEIEGLHSLIVKLEGQQKRGVSTKRYSLVARKVVSP